MNNAESNNQQPREDDFFVKIAQQKAVPFSITANLLPLIQHLEAAIQNIAPGQNVYDFALKEDNDLTIAAEQLLERMRQLWLAAEEIPYEIFEIWSIRLAHTISDQCRDAVVYLLEDPEDETDELLS